MAIVIPQEMSLRSARPNFTRDLVESLPLNSLAEKDYDIGHRVYLSHSMTLPDSTVFPEGVYMFCKTSSGINNYDRWKLLVTLDGEINLNGLTEKVQANTNKNTEQDTRLNTLESVINTVTPKVEDLEKDSTLYAERLTNIEDKNIEQDDRIAKLESGGGGGGGTVTVTVDSTLSTKSTNPVQNKVITSELYAVKESNATKTNSLQVQSIIDSNKAGFAKKTEIPTVPTKVSELTNDKNFINISIVEAKGYDTIANVNNKLKEYTKTTNLATVATSGSYNDLADKPNIPSGVVVDLTLNEKSNNAVANSAVTTKLKEVEDAIPTDTVTSAQLNAVKTTAESKTDMSSVETYVGQQGFAKSSEIPTDNKDLTNGANYATTSRVNEVEAKIKPFPILATVATTGSYNDLKDKPTIPKAITIDTELSDTSTNPVQNKKVKAAIDAKTTLAEVKQQNYATKTDLSTVESKIPTKHVNNSSDEGYLTLTNIAKINGNTITNGGNITIEAGGEAAVVDGALDKLSNNAIANSAVATEFDLYTKTINLSKVAKTGNYNDLDSKPTIPTNTNQLTNGAGYQTDAQVKATIKTNPEGFAKSSEIPTIPTNVSTFTNDANYTTMTLVEAKGYKNETGVNTLIDAKMKTLAKVATSGNYNDLSNKPNIPAGVVVDLTLDSTSNDAIANSAVTNKFNEVIASIPKNTVTSTQLEEVRTLASGKTTLAEVQEQGYQNSVGVQSIINTNTANFQNEAEVKAIIKTNPEGFAKSSEIPKLPTLATVATTGSYNDLKNKPTIPSVDLTLDKQSNNAIANSKVASELDLCVKNTSLSTINGNEINTGLNVKIEEAFNVIWEPLDIEVSTEGIITLTPNIKEKGSYNLKPTKLPDIATLKLILPTEYKDMPYRLVYRVIKDTTIQAGKPVLGKTTMYKGNFYLIENYKLYTIITCLNPNSISWNLITDAPKIPVNVSDLQNDATYQTQAQVNESLKLYTKSTEFSKINGIDITKGTPINVGETIYEIFSMNSLLELMDKNILEDRNCINIIDSSTVGEEIVIKTLDYYTKPPILHIKVSDKTNASLIILNQKGESVLKKVFKGRHEIFTVIFLGGLIYYTIPSKTSELVNDAEFITKEAIPTQVSTFTNDVNYQTKKDIENMGYAKMWFGTQQQYDAIVTKEPKTVYNIYE